MLILNVISVYNAEDLILAAHLSRELYLLYEELLELLEMFNILFKASQPTTITSALN